ncbi:hypothetical protein Pst134EA_000582 [Puccinia striiformis f. sp. tritici]|uniref:uncharacterized protein n=1 Tax=Puccinia striiformis f. sp. tritici TaxID=168172 RepID=UPI0020077D65|nr:uncharacterized protein Pst134EA_032717 [Puccinia striiformis f. sp. tritici]XP_047812957.1 hypothetical protein Pst134EA_000582 [Puccinia striiformis f. sp. tritici]KAH9441665.1 hypothetical protein Pst134EA_032717 [Puccinia striiformis f. sp. tritici]KAH9473503.1 hypothetical protein Pst134EA_000582 [Puccinia striiformis f. sp. tritici]
MLEAHDDPSDELVEAKGYLESASGALDGFERLIVKYDYDFERGATARPNPEVSLEQALSTLNLRQANSKEALLDQLDSELLPLLNDQLNTLSLSLLPSALWKEPHGKYKLIIETQFEIERSIDQIKLYIATVSSGSNPTRYGTDDQHLKRLKSHTLHSFSTGFNEGVMILIPHIFKKARELLNRIEDASDELKPEFDNCFHRQEFTKLISRTTSLIDWVIERIRISELDIVQECWVSGVPRIDDCMRQIGELLNPSPTTDSSELDGQENPRKLEQECIIKLARLTIPILKLCRLFYKKLIEGGIMRMIRSPIFTEMCSDQLNSLAQTIHNIPDDIRRLIPLFQKADESLRDVTSSEFTQLANNLKSRLQSPLLLVLMYLVPLIPDTQNLYTQDYYRTWFSTWNLQFIISVHNFVHAVPSLGFLPF